MNVIKIIAHWVLVAILSSGLYMVTSLIGVMYGPACEVTAVLLIAVALVLAR